MTDLLVTAAIAGAVAFGASLLAMSLRNAFRKRPGRPWSKTDGSGAHIGDGGAIYQHHRDHSHDAGGDGGGD